MKGNSQKIKYMLSNLSINITWTRSNNNAVTADKFSNIVTKSPVTSI